MSKLYFLVLLLVSLGCASAQSYVPSTFVEPLAVWFSANDATVRNASTLIDGWKSTRPADNPMRPYLTTKNKATIGQAVSGSNYYRTVLLRDSCLRMSGYYSVQTTQGWSVAIHATRGQMASGYLFGGSHEANTPAILTTSNSSYPADSFEWYSCNGFVGTTGNLCERYPIMGSGVKATQMNTIIVTYAPNSVRGNTTIYWNGAQKFVTKTKTNNRNWDLNAIGCSGWGDTKQSRAQIADFRIYEKILTPAEALEVHLDMKNRTRAYEAPVTVAPVPTTAAPQPTMPEVAPNITKTACSGHGFYLTSDATRCICDSGYEGTECEDATALDGNCTVNIAETMRGDWYPHLNTAANHSSFAAGTLQTEIFANIVKNRTFGGLTFKDANDSRCYLGAKNSFWQQTVDNCSDTFTLGLPFGAFSTLCGFKKASTASGIVVYKAVVEMTYFDTLLDKQVLGEFLMRRTKVKFDLILSFPTYVEIMIEQVEVVSQVEVKAMISQFEYDFARSRMMVQLITSLDWPNMLSEEGMEIAFSNNNTMIAPLGELTIDNTGCLNVENTKCKQKFYFELMLVGDSCSFDGDYQLNMTVVTCREDNATAICTADNTDDVDLPNMVFHVIGSTVCGEVTAEPKITATLIPYADYQHTVVATQGVIGESGYFFVNLVSDGESTLKMRFLDISVYIEGGNKTFLLEEGFIKTPGVRSSLTVYDDDRKFNLTFNGNTFPVLPQTSEIFIFAVKVEVTYTGNEGYVTKRELKEIEAYYTPTTKSSMTASTRLGLSRGDVVAPVEDVDVVATPSKSNKIALVTIIAPLAGVVVVAVIAAAIYSYTKSSKKQTTFYAKL